MAIDELSQLIHLSTDNVPGAPPAEDIPNEETIDPQKPDLTWTPDPTKTGVHSQVVGVQNAGGKAYGKATGLYNKHQKYSEQWNPWCSFQSAHDFEWAQSYSQQTKMWMDQHLWCELPNFNIESFQSGDAVWNLLSRLDFRLANDNWIEDHSHIFRTLYNMDIFKCIQFLLEHVLFQPHLNFKPVPLADSESRGIYSKLNTGDWWQHMHDQLPASATIVAVIWTSDKTHLANFSGDQLAWPLYLTINNIHNDIRHAPNKCACIIVQLIPCPPKCAKNTNEVCHCTVGTLLSPLRNLHITDSGSKWDCADGFQTQCYHHLASSVGDHPEQLMVA